MNNVINKPNTVLCEEKNLTEVKNLSINETTIKQCDITNEIKNPSEKSVCNDIEIEKTWTRNCPKCGKIHIYSRKSGWKRAITKNCLCKECTIQTEKYKINRSLALKKIKRSDEFKQKISRVMKGRKITWIDKIIPKVKGRIVPIEQEIKRLESRLGMNYDEYLKRKPKYFVYKSRVMSITRRQSINLLENHDKIRTLAGKKGGYQLDHIITIKDGFELHINPHIIGNINNLRLISWEENLKKNKNTNIVINDKYKNNILNVVEMELLKIYSKYDNRLYKYMKVITDKWYEHPNITKDYALKLAKGVANNPQYKK